jgi:ABC-type sugar transport system substrate-binding protein
MMKLKVRSLALMIALLLVLGMVAACTPAQTETPAAEAPATEAPAAEATEAPAAAEGDKEVKKIGYSIMNIDNPYFISVKKGVEDRCKELGIEVIVSDAGYDAATQYSHFENFISMGVDGIIADPIDQKSLTDIVEQAKAAGIPVVGEAQPIDNASANCIVNEYDYGYLNGTQAAKWINEKLGGKGKVVIISQDNVEAVIQRGNGLQDAILKLAPESEIVARQAGDTPEMGMKIAESVLQSRPDVNVIVGVNDSGALGAYEAVKNMGIDTTNFLVGGADFTAEAQAKIKEEGSFYRYTIDIQPYETGKKCVDLILEVLKNGPKTEPDYFTMEAKWQGEF